jgi:hypothetical protein
MHHNTTCRQYLSLKADPSNEGRAAMLRQDRDIVSNLVSVDDANDPADCRYCATGEARYRAMEIVFARSLTSFSEATIITCIWFRRRSCHGLLCFGGHFSFA